MYDSAQVRLASVVSAELLLLSALDRDECKQNFIRIGMIAIGDYIIKYRRKIVGNELKQS